MTGTGSRELVANMWKKGRNGRRFENLGPTIKCNITRKKLNYNQVNVF